MVAHRHVVVFQPMGLRTEVEDGHQLRDAAKSAGIEIRSLCGERINCGKCRVVVEQGNFERWGIESRLDHLTAMQAGEKDYWSRRRKGLFAQGYDPDTVRLSCQAHVQGDLVITVPETSQTAKQVVSKAARPRAVEVHPHMRKLFVELRQATLADNESDWERLVKAIAQVEPLTRSMGEQELDIDSLTIDLPALQALQNIVRQGEWALSVTIWNGKEVIRVEPGFSDLLIGMAVDIGTTTVAAYLCDLLTGEILATEDTMNPQVAFGEDIMSRISFAIDNPDGLEKLHKALIKVLNELAQKSCRQINLKPKEIISMVVVGNTAMHHLFLNLDPTSLGRSPYIPATKKPIDLRARDLGLINLNPGAYVHVLPLIASFVGADCMAVLLAEAPHEQEENWLIVDVGTNAELVLGNQQRLVCTSTPTGPVFEGGHMEHGMRAAVGAIERVEIEDWWKPARFKVIGDPSWSDDTKTGGIPARGICGSGIIDAVAELYRTEIIQPDGLFIDQELPFLRRSADKVEYILAQAHQTINGQEISISQEDIRQLQLAKAPLYVAARYLLNSLGLKQPDRILLAGGFGANIDPKKALLIGMIPDCPLERVYAVGNSAGDGARIALLNHEKSKQAAHLAGKIERIELPIQAGFQDQFTLALHFPHMVHQFPSLEGIAPERQPDPMARRLFGNNIPDLESK